MIINFIKEYVKIGLFKMGKVDTSKNISNVLTKIVCGKEFFESFTQIMGNQNNSHSLTSWEPNRLAYTSTQHKNQAKAQTISIDKLTGVC